LKTPGIFVLWTTKNRTKCETIYKTSKKVKEAQDAEVHVTACKACANQLGITETLEKLNIEIMYWGEPLTKILTNDEKLLTI